jgi:dihydroxyacetone kinase
MDAHAVELGRLDAVAGDGDHGLGMQRGATAAFAAGRSLVGRGAGAGTVLAGAAAAWADRAGGASGALWGIGLGALGARLGDSTAPSSRDIAEAVAAAVEAVISHGKAELGAKTMVDALLPFSRELSARVEDGATIADAWASAVAVAEIAAVATADLLPRVGRARPHAAKSLGTPDPGAISLSLIVRAIGDILIADRNAERT